MRLPAAVDEGSGQTCPMIKIRMLMKLINERECSCAKLPKNQIEIPDTILTAHFM
jgi:hypothetical protein